MDKASRVEKFYYEGAGCRTFEQSVDLNRFMIINDRIYSIKCLNQVIKKDWFKCPGGHIDCLGVELSFDTDAVEFLGFDSVKDRDLFYSYINRWLFDDESFNVINIYYASEKEEQKI